MGQHVRHVKVRSFNGLMQVGFVNGKDPEEAKERDHFPGLTPLYPEKQMVLETTRGRIASRMLDLICPIGFGQRWAYCSSAKSREDKFT